MNNLVVVPHLREEEEEDAVAKAAPAMLLVSPERVAIVEGGTSRPCSIAQDLRRGLRRARRIAVVDRSSRKNTWRENVQNEREITTGEKVTQKGPDARLTDAIGRRAFCCINF